MEIQKLRGTEMEEALQLVWEGFCTFEAPVFPAQGVEGFRSFLQNREEMARQQFLGAWEGGLLVGVLAARGPHISLFFVRREWHRRGVGRALLHAMAAGISYAEATVHSSPYAVEVYRRFGFVPLGGEREENGIRYTPMVCRKWTF